jgi:sugar lactone lactonase YvrE
MAVTALEADSFADCVVSMPGGRVVAGGNGRGNALNQLCIPHGVAVANDGSIFVADMGNHRVVKWGVGAGHGVVVAGGNGPGSALNQLFWPRGVAFAPDGAVIVADEKNDRVVRWDEGAHEGIVVAGGHGRGNALSQLCGPVGVALTKSGDILVADTGNNRVMRWTKGFDAFGEVIAPRDDVNVRVANDGSIVVARDDRSIAIFDPSRTKIPEAIREQFQLAPAPTPPPPAPRPAVKPSVQKFAQRPQARA